MNYFQRNRPTFTKRDQYPRNVPLEIGSVNTIQFQQNLTHFLVEYHQWKSKYLRIGKMFQKKGIKRKNLNYWM